MAGNLGSDKIQLEVIIDGTPARKELVELSKATAQLKAEQDKIIAQQKALKDQKRSTTDAAEIRKITAEETKLREERRKGIDAITANNAKLAELRKEIGITALSYRELQQRQTALRNALRAGANSLGTEEYNRLEAELVDVDKQMNKLGSSTERQIRVWDRMRQGMKLSQMTGEQLELEIKRLQMAINRTPAGDVMGLRRLRTELTAAEKELARMRNGLGPFGRLWAEVKGQVAAAGAVMMGMFAAGGIANGVQGLIRSSKEYSDQLSDVRKTTGLTGDAVKALASEISKIDTRTSRQELLALARDAGKLGLSGKEDIMAFVTAGNQIRTALGEDLGDDAIKNIAKLVDLFKLKETFGLEQAMLNVGSAINELGMASTASEGYMVEFLKRMGGIAPIAGITIDQTLALGATLDSLGQTSEVSSTALSKLFVKLGTDAEKYAGLAGMSVEKFRDILQNNALEAFIAVLDGTKKTEGGVVALAETLGDMGIDAARAAGVFGVLSNNTERLREQMGLANKAFLEGTSVTDEYALKNNNLAAQLEKLGKEFNRLFANNTMIDWLTSLVNLSRDAIAWIQRNKDAVQAFLKLLVTAVGVWGGYRLAVALATRAQILANTVTTAAATVWRLLTGQIKLAELAMSTFNRTSKLNPFGLIIGAVTTLAGALWTMKSAMDAVSNGIAKEITDMQMLLLQISTTNQGTEERKRLIEELKALYPEYLSQINSDTASNEDLGRAVAFVNEQLINKAVLAKEDKILEESNAKVAERKYKIIETERDLRVRMAELAKEYNLEINTSLPLLERARDLQVKISELVRPDKSAALPLKEVFGSFGAFNEVLTGYANDLRVVGDMEGKSNALAQRRMELMKELGMNVRDAASAERALAAATGETSEKQEVQVRSVAFLNAAIKKLQEDQEKVSDPKEYKRLQAQIDALEKERERITGAKNKQAADKNQEHLDNLLRQYQEFEGNLRLGQMTDDQRELEELDRKHAAELDKVRKQQEELIKAKKLTPEQAQTDLNTLGTQNAAERDALIDAQNDRKLKQMREANERIEKLLGEGRNQILQQDLELLEAQIDLAEQRGDSTVALERKRRDLLLEIYDQNATDAITAEAAKWDAVIREQEEALQKYKDSLGKNGLDPTEQEEAAIKEQTDNIAALTLQKNKIIEGINDRHRAREAAENQRMTQAERAELVKRWQYAADIAGAIGNLFQSIVSIYDAQISAAERVADADGKRTQEEMARIEQLRAARRRAALTTIATQGAAAIASGVASAASIGYPQNIPAIISIVATIAGMIAQAKALYAEDSNMSSTTTQQQGQGSLQNVPWGDEGLQVRGKKVLRAADGGGVLGGNLHSDGGNTLFDNRTGEPLAEVERNELMLIMSRRATEANKDLIPMLLKASREGTRIGTFSRPMPMPNLQKVRQAVGVPNLAGGGVTGTVYTFSKATGLAQQGHGSYDELIEVVREMAGEMNQTRIATQKLKEVKAVASIIDINRKSQQYDDLRAANSTR